MCGRARLSSDVSEIKLMFSIPPARPAPNFAASSWLGEEPADTAELKALLAPYPSDEMICWPVSPRVGSVKNNDASLIEPIVLQ